MYVVNRPYYPPPCRPPVYPGCRPVYGYNPPPNYHWNQCNRNINVNVNNNYYNRFNNTSTSSAYNRPGAGGGGTENPRLAQNNNWKGQTTYQGTRPATAGQKPGASMANAIPHDEQYGYHGNNQVATNRANAGNLGSTEMAANRSNMGNSGAMNRGGSATGSNISARSTPQPDMNRGGDRGYAAPSSSTRPTPSTAANCCLISPSPEPGKYE